MVRRYKFASAWNGGDQFIADEIYVLASEYDALSARLAERKDIRIARLEGLLRQCNEHGRLEGTAVLQEIEVALAASQSAERKS
jgi:hypothetical protein